MAIEAAQPQRWWPVLFVLAAGAFAARLWALRHADINLDESTFIIQAGLVASGVKLYLGTTCQHMPLDVMAIHPLAALGLLDSPAPYRGLVSVAQLLAAWSLARSRAFSQAPAWGFAVGILYLFFYAGLATLLKGHIYSSYALAGAAWVASFSLLGLPLLVGRTPSNEEAFAGAAAYAVWALSSPALGLAALLYLGACAACPDMRARTWVAALCGGSGVLLLEATWLWHFGDLAAWFQQAIIFNATVYPGLNHEAGPSGLAWGAVIGAYDAAQRLSLAGWLVLALPVALLWRLRSAGARYAVPTLLMLLSFLLLRVRHFYWKGLPFDCASFAGMGAALFLLVEPLQGRARALGLGLTAAVGLLLLGSVAAVARANPSFDYWGRGKAGSMQQQFVELRRRLPEGATLLAIPNSPHYFMLTGLPPAYGLVLYGPVSVALDFPPSGPPRDGNLCQKMALDPPALIYDRRDGSMFYHDVATMMPRCVDAVESAQFVRTAWKNWWVRKDLENVLKGLPNQAGPPWADQVP